MSKRREKRRDNAELVCKEIRSQIVKYGGVLNNEKVCKLIIQWLKHGVKDSYNKK